MARIFTGDFSTGDFSQWSIVNNKDYSGEGSGWPGLNYPARVISEDKDCGYVARFEVRTGDVPGFGGAERSEVSGVSDTDLLDGETAWYAFSIKFDASFPVNHHALGWGIFAQWHDIDSLYSPIITLGFKSADPDDGLSDGYWYIVQNPQNPGGTFLGSKLLLTMPMDVGQWQDIKLQIKASSDPSIGFIKAWRNDQPQTMFGGTQTFTGQTLVPGASGMKVQMGYYRQNDIPSTGILYQTGFRIADTESSL